MQTILIIVLIAVIVYFVYSKSQASARAKSDLEKYKSLEPIEKMPEKEKKEMKKYVISLFPEKTPEEKVEACKIIYTIGTLL